MTEDGSSHDACVEFIAEYYFKWNILYYFSHIQRSFGILGNIGSDLFEKDTTISGGSRISPGGAANIRFCQIFPKTA